MMVSHSRETRSLRRPPKWPRSKHLTELAQRPYKNRILAALPQSELSHLASHLTPVALRPQETLLDGKANYGYFVEDGVASVIASVADGNTVEIGVVGIDGIVGLPILLGAGTGPGRTFVQIAGSGYRIPAAVLKEEFERPSELRQLLQRYIQGFLVQSAQSAACNRLHGIEARLSYWLLACHDRMESDALHLTHEVLGLMLGSPRTTVTLAAGLLQRAGLISYSRGVLTVTNRAELESAACECYGIVRKEFRRLKLL